MIIKVEKSVSAKPSVNWGEAAAGPGGPLVPVLLVEAEGVKVLLVFTSPDEARSFGAMACFEAVTCELAAAQKVNGAALASSLVRPDGGPMQGGGSL